MTNDEREVLQRLIAHYLGAIGVGPKGIFEVKVASTPTAPVAKKAVA